MSLSEQSAQPSSRPLLEGVFVGIAVLVTAVAGIGFMAFRSVSTQQDIVRTDLLRVARAASALVDGDLHEKLASGPRDDGDYATLLAPLIKLHRQLPEVAYMYTLIERDGRFRFVLDTATAADQLGFNRPMQPSEFMKPYQSQSAEEDKAEMDALKRGTTFVSHTPFSDEYGTFLTALSPVRTTDGRAVATLGVDMDIGDYLNQINRIWNAALIALLAAVIGSCVVGGAVYRIRKKLRLQEMAGAKSLSEKEALKEQDRRLVSALGQVVYHYDESSKRTKWRGDCERILGYPPREMPAEMDQWNSRIHPKDAAAIQAWSDARSGPETSLIREYRHLHRDGHPVWLMDRAVLSRDETGKLLSVDGVLLDISAQKNVEAQLIAARDAAEAADRAKTDFLAIMSHEIRTPMNGVIGCVNLLLETPITPEQREYLGTIRKCGDGLIHLINDILDFSKMESDKLTLETRPFSLVRCVEEVTDLYALAAAEKNIELVTRFETDAPDGIVGDETRFRQILVNLVGNALKFTASGEIIISLSVKPWLPSGEALMLSVKDTGIGIPEEKQKRIFLPFSQADSSTTRRFGGTGLGLAICGRLAALMGGAITVHSSEGCGAEFVVLTPLKRSKEPGRELPDLGGRSALIVDDNAAFRRATQDFLHSLGMSVRLADSPDSTRSALASDGLPDVVLLDVCMPAEHVASILSQIEKVDPAGRARVIELKVPSLLRKQKEASDTPHRELNKPLRRKALAEMLREVILGAAPSLPPTPSTSLPSMAGQSPLKILIAEDNAINRKVLTRMLARLGYTSEAVENGRLCVERLAAEKFDIVFMDIQMPEMDGYEATAVLRQRGDKVWITALTADAMPDDPLRCKVAGMNDYLTKPLRPDALREALEHCADHLKANPRR